MSHALSSLFDDCEAIACNGEIELKDSHCAIPESEWKRREAEALALLAQNGDDTNGNPLGTDGKPVASQDIMAQGKRVSDKSSAQRSEFVSEAALHSGATRFSNRIASRGYVMASRMRSPT